MGNKAVELGLADKIGSY